MDPRDSVSLLTGTWHIGASNLPVWLRGQRRAPTVAYHAVAKHPLWLVHTLAYSTADGHTERVSAIARWRRGRFVSRGRGIRKLFASAWWVSGSGADGAIAVIRFAKTRAAPAGISVLVRSGRSIPQLRMLVGDEHERFGLTPEEFARLSWFAAPVAPRRMRP
jgi:hypothetical protein